MATAEAAPDVKVAADGDFGSPASAALPKGEAPSCGRQSIVNDSSGRVGIAWSWRKQFQQSREATKLFKPGQCDTS